MRTIAVRQSTFDDPRIRLRVCLASFIAARQRARALRLALKGMAAGNLVAVFVGVLARSFDISSGLVLAVIVVVAATIAGGIVGWTRRQSTTRVALDVDRRLGFDERVTTALEFSTTTAATRPSRSAASAKPVADNAPVALLTTQQIDDAVSHLASARPTSVYPLRVTTRSLALAIATSALAIAPWLVAWPAILTAAAPPSRVAATTQAEAARLDAVADQVESQATPSDSLIRSQVATQLRQAADSLRQSQASGAQAASSLNQAQKSTAGLAPQTGEDASLTLARIADALNTQAVTQPMTSALDQQDVNQAAADLQQLATRIGSMSGQQRQDLANSLQAASNASQASDTNTATALQQAANAARNGDQAGMQQAAQALQQLGAASQAQSLVSQAQSELQSSSAAVAQAAENGSSVTGQASVPLSANNQPAQATQDQSAGSNDTGATTDASQAGSGSQAGGQQGGEGQDSASQQANGSPAGGYGTGTANHLGLPNQSQGLAQRQISVPTDQRGDPVSLQASNQLQTGTAGTAQVDYVNVLPQYQQQAQQAVDGNVVPNGLKQVVKGYFDSLTPK